MRVASLILICAIYLNAHAQSDSSSVESRDLFDFNGYIKLMQISSFEDDLDDISNDNLIHNRLNFRFYPSADITMALEIRNRVFTGETVEDVPNYADFVAIDDGLVDMSWLIVDEPSLIALLQIDRAWMEWSNEQWEVRVGRQRINWGTNLFWNANDLFNVYSLVDFDYEERPGSDALRVQRHFKDMSTIDLALSAGEDEDDRIAALRYQFNHRQYDIQILAAKWYDDYVAGLGWAGNMWQAGFKGEMSLFVPENGGKSVLSTSISSDYVFKNELFLTGGLLYNSEVSDPDFIVQGQILGVANLTAKQLMPNKLSTIISAQYPFSPILSGGLIGIYGSSEESLFIMPSLGYSLSDNWELALFGQSFWLEQDSFKNIGNGLFIRMKGSF